MRSQRAQKSTPVTVRTILESILASDGKLWSGGVPGERAEAFSQAREQGLVRWADGYWMLTEIGARELRGGNPAATVGG